MLNQPTEGSTAYNVTVAAAVSTGGRGAGNHIGLLGMQLIAGDLVGLGDQRDEDTHLPTTVIMLGAHKGSRTTCKGSEC